MVEASRLQAGSRGPDGEPLSFFTTAEAAVTAAAMARIFPSDAARPGAREAGTVVYLDRALAGADRDLQGTYRTGLRRLAAISGDRFGAGFETCAPAQQDQLIGEMAEGSLAAFGVAPTGLEFFELLRAHTIEGLFADPVHGGNRDFVGWNLLGYHGPQPSYSHAEQQLDARIVRDRIYTAADYPLPASDTGK
jgi:gluconate 2-dehydrogenase gamma chain